MKRNWLSALVTFLSVAFILGGLPPVYAQEEAEGDAEEKEVFTLDEIIVTATKRKESILEVPVSISAFNYEMMGELGITSTEDLEQLTPSLQFGTGAGQGTTIRGVSSRLWATTHADQAVAYYVDGVYSYTLAGVAPHMFDMDRVEIARGPQGTLHGRNSIAGAISFFPKRPTDEWDAEVLVEVTDQVTRRYNAALGGPIPFFGRDWLSFRITAGIEEGDGAYENIGLGPDDGKPDEKFFFPQLRLKTDRLDINVRYAEREDHGVPWPESMRLVRPDPQDYWYDRDVRVSETFPWEFSVWYLDNEPLPVSSLCPPGEPMNDCEDLQLMTNTNAPTYNDDMRKEWTVNAEFELTENFTLVYTHGQSKSETRGGYDTDGTNATGGWDGELWWVNRSGNWRDDGRTLSSTTGAEVADRRTRSSYDVEQSSHELMLRSNFDGPFNFLAGVFYYQNETAGWGRTDDYTGNVRFNDNVFYWDQLRLSTTPPHRWGNFPLYEQYMIDNHNYDPDTFVGGEDGLPGVAPGTAAECNMFAHLGGQQFWGTALSSDPDFFVYCDYRTDRLEASGWRNSAASDTRAAFIHGDYQFGNWMLSGGVRYTKDAKKQSENSWYGVGDFANVIVNSGNDDAHSQLPTWEQYIWDVSLEYTPEGNTMYYGRVAKGYRAGNFSTYAVEVGFESPNVGEETLINFEVGVKSQSTDQRLTLTSSAFYSLYDDMQIDLMQNYPPGAAISPQAKSPLVEFTSNIPTSDLYGLEAELTYYPAERWRFSGYYVYFNSSLGEHWSVTPGHPNPAWQDREYLIFVGDTYDVNISNPAYIFSDWDENGNAVPILDEDTGEPALCEGGAGVCYSVAQYQAMDEKTGNEMPKQPNHKLSLTGSYTHPLQLGNRDLGSLTILSTYSYTGIRHPYIGNLSSQEMRAYGRWDARLWWNSPGGNWSVTGFVQNILGDIGLMEYIPMDGTTPFFGNPEPSGVAARAMLGDGRRFGLILRWNM